MKFDYNCNNCGKMNVIVMHELINGDSYCLSCHSQLLISDGESINQRNSLDLIYQLGKKIDYLQSQIDNLENDSYK